MKKLFVVAIVASMALAACGKKKTSTPAGGGSDMGSATAPAGSDMGSAAAGSGDAPAGGGSAM